MSIEDTIRKDIAVILKELKGELHSLLGDNFSRMILFGSMARGDWEDESDVDIALIVKNLSKQTRDAIYEKVAEIEIEHTLPVSILMFSEDMFNHLKKRERRIVLDIEREGITL